MPYLTKRVDFCASHYYWNPDFSDEQNQQIFRSCANRHGHGHNYSVEVTLRGPIHPQTGMIINFFDLDPILQRLIVVPLDHKNLNAQVPYFASTLPTLENITLYLQQQLAPEVGKTGLTLDKIKVIETNELYVETNGVAPPMLTLTRRYPFSAAHRLWNPDFSPEENARHFGKCVNLHGHNYTLEVTVTGIPNPQTGMIMDLVALDERVNDVILSAVDHKHLDQDVPFLNGVLSTVENVAQVFYQRLAAEIQPPATLHRVRLYESDQHWTEVTREEMSPHEQYAS
jgi:6-pyruvoyltetrahydropterin/6-carboxytetrahydropterin synthase